MPTPQRRKSTQKPPTLAKPSKGKSTTPIPFKEIHAALTAAFQAVQAPIMDLIAAQTHDPYKILVGTILSARTQDAVTAQACTRLFTAAPTLDALGTLSVEQIQKLIYPVGFFRDKAKHLHDLPATLHKHFAGKIPCEIDDLITLPGVGRKTANLVRVLAFDLPAICVDTHVHRINNRLGIVKTKTPLETEMALRQVLPEHFWKEWNAIFVSFGQTRCRPIGPHCEGCPLLAIPGVHCRDYKA